MSTDELLSKNPLHVIQRSSRAELLLVVITIVYTVAIGLARPAHYWDVIGFVGSAYEADGYNGQELSAKTFGDIRSYFGNADFAKYTEGHYQATVYRDPTALEQQLPFYSIRIVQVDLMRLLNPLVGNYARSANIVTVTFTGLWITALATLMFMSSMSLFWLPLVVAFAFPSALSGGGASADQMACFFALLTLISLHVESRGFYVCAAFLPLVRTDLIILSILTLAAHIGQMLIENRSAGGLPKIADRGDPRRWRLLAACAALFASFGAYEGINAYAGNYGWLTVFNFTFIDFNPYPKTMPISHAILPYVLAYKNGLMELLASSLFPVYMLGVALLARQMVSMRSVSKYDLSFIAVPLGFSALHFVLFPLPQLRFFIFASCCIMVALLRAVGRASRSQRAAALT
jgi:hypothetical protein